MSKPVIKPATDFISSSLTARLPASLTVAEIVARLPGVEDEGESSDGKATHHWQFTVDGNECAIWDYKGAKWSAYDPGNVLGRVFPEIRAAF